MSKNKIIIVNEHDEKIGLKERGTLKQHDIYRVSALWITNSNGDILLAQRSFNKKNDPGLCGPAVAGTNDEGESYESNIVKETEEEIGLTHTPFKKAFKNFREGEHRYFAQWFVAVVDKEIGEFTIQEEEVEQIKWFPRKELILELESNPEKFLKGLKELISTFK